MSARTFIPAIMAIKPGEDETGELYILLSFQDKHGNEMYVRLIKHQVIEIMIGLTKMTGQLAQIEDERKRRNGS